MLTRIIEHVSSAQGSSVSKSRQLVRTIVIKRLHVDREFAMVPPSETNRSHNAEPQAAWSTPKHPTCIQSILMYSMENPGMPQMAELKCFADLQNPFMSMRRDLQAAPDPKSKAGHTPEAVASHLQQIRLVAPSPRQPHTPTTCFNQHQSPRFSSIAPRQGRA